MPWTRWRWVQPGDDRPLTFPPPGPYWCSGYDAEDNAILIAYLPHGVHPTDAGWPEAEGAEALEGSDGPEFSERFPRPKWWPEAAA